MRIRLLDVEFDAVTVEDLQTIVSETIVAGDCKIIANHNLHSIYLCHFDSRMRNFYSKADKIHIDGMPLIFLARFFGYPVKREQRVTYLDWIWKLIDQCARRHWRVLYVGGKPGVAERAAQYLQQTYPAIELKTHHGYFAKNDSENSRVLELIRSFKPNILLVGMGMPIQEHWILQNLSQIEANVILPAGACFDYLAGVVPMPPRWMGSIGLEWLFRLAMEPRRLWKRYLLEPWYILGLVWKEWFKRNLE